MRQITRNIIILVVAAIIIFAVFFMPVKRDPYVNKFYSFDISSPSIVAPGQHMDFSIKISATNTARYSIDNCGLCGLSRGVCLYYLGNETIPHSKNFIYQSCRDFYWETISRSTNISSCYSSFPVPSLMKGKVPVNTIIGVGTMEFNFQWNATTIFCQGNRTIKTTYANAAPGYYSIIPNIIIRSDNAAPKTNYVDPQIITVCGPEMEFQNISGNIYMKEHFIGKYNNQPASVHVLCYYYNFSNPESCTSNKWLNFTLTNNHSFEFPKLNQTMRKDFGLAVIYETWGNLTYKWAEFKYAV